ncbi:MAG TPA: beta-L-arabinofuranosidase domain-containing protein, partial [Fimbriimonadaceae bacterium]|nr:beta-L-arabinofuranosidase domain-containing protein [Fimbriimonadaceae bacterium]
RLEFGGPVGERIAANRRNWLMTAPQSNPAMLDMFRERDRMPERDLLPWSGEFAGKYLTSAVECYRLDRNLALRKQIERFVADLIATQGADGYLGPFPEGTRFFGKDLWDLWGQYHCMLGLFRWYEESGDAHALAACRRAADLFCRVFLDGNRRVVEAGSEEMNESCIHIFTLLYATTGEPRYLALARSIEEDFATPPSGDYIRQSLAGRAFYQLPKPRWEGLHAVQGIAELYFITGDEKYRRAFEQIWWTIDEFDRHNTGGFSSGEQAQGNPYDPRPIETCCTIAWSALSLDMLRMTGDSRAADELELSLFNGVLGAQEPNGRWWTYNTPMDGERKAATQDIAFQARPGSPELSCCSVNGPRGLGMLSDWAAMSAPDGLAVNYYGPSAFRVHLANGSEVGITQKTTYPVSGRVSLTVDPSPVSRFAVRLRIPGWSAATKVTLNGKAVGGAQAGSYLVLDRRWKPGDHIELDFDMSPWVWVGERECSGKASIYHGPILLAYDPRFGPYAPGSLPVVAPGAAQSASAATGGILTERIATPDGKFLTLSDFASAGTAGNPYVSWLPVTGLASVPFSRANPLRVQRPARP